MDHEKKRPVRPWTVLDLFAGAGGMALGFEAAGARSIGFVEVDPVAAETLAAMFGESDPIIFGGPERGDMTRLSADEILEALPSVPDVIVGGPPCQGFSRVGRPKQNSLLDEGERVRHGGLRKPYRNELYRYFLDVVQRARPKAFVMENVPGMREILGVDMAGRIAREAAHLGYNVRYFLLNAAWYGVPQQRWRIFFVGLRSDLAPHAIPEPPFRTRRHSPDIPEGIRLPEDRWMIWGPQIPEIEDSGSAVTVREALHDLPRLTEHLAGRKPVDRPLPLYREPSAWAEDLRRWPGRKAGHTVLGNWHRFTPRDFRIFREMAHGDCYPQALIIAHRSFRRHLTELRKSGSAPRPDTPEYDRLRRRFIPPYRNDAFDEKWRKLIPGDVSWTLTAHISRDTYSHVHYLSNQARMITIREAARLQSFPDAFNFCGSHNDQFRQIGNAVPPILAKAIATQLHEQLSTF